MPNLVLALLLASVAAPADVVVVCPAGFQPALRPWVEHRERQGHVIEIIAPLATPAATKQAIDQVADREALRAILLVGDAPALTEPCDPQQTTPTWHLDSQVVVAWGSEPQMAGDNPYADFDADQRPDVAIGRLPVDSPAELSQVVAKIIAYENTPSLEFDRRRVNVIAGVGGFSSLVDTVLETAAAKLITQGVPAPFQSTMTYGSWRSPYCPDPRLFHHACLARWNEGCLFWVYIGHGNRRQLDQVRTPVGVFPILHAEQANRLQSGSTPPIAVFLACYTTAFDGEQDCLAEEMLRQPGGPIAVLGGSRVTMPYAMSVFGNYLLEESFAKRRGTLGEVILNAKRRLTAPVEAIDGEQAAADEPGTRALLDAVAMAISPNPQKLAEERLEHAQLFNLLGDPLLRLPLPAAVSVQSPPKARAGETIKVEIESELPGECFVEVVCRRDRLTFSPPARPRLEPTDEALRAMVPVYMRANDHRWSSQHFTHAGGKQTMEIALPSESHGYAHVRVFLAGAEDCAIGASDLYILTAASP